MQLTSISVHLSSLPSPPLPSPPLPSPQGHKGKKGGKVSRADLDQCRLMLETQTRVCETLEQERDRANDDYDFAQVTVTMETIGQMTVTGNS